MAGAARQKLLTPQQREALSKWQAANASACGCGSGKPAAGASCTAGCGGSAPAPAKPAGRQ